MSQSYENMRGELNPMHRPEVAAKQSASLRKTWADPARRKQMLAHKDRLEAIRLMSAKEAAAPKVDRKWSDERKQAHSAKMKAYWAKVHAALAAVGESQHED